MGISKSNDKLVQNASRKLLQLEKVNPTFKKFTTLLKSHAAMCGRKRKVHIPELEEPQAIFSTLDININGCQTQSCIGKSVVDILLRRPKLFTFKEACAILAHCDEKRHRVFIEDIIQKYAIVILGLQGFAEEDLDLAVYFFIEDVFGIQANIELCVRLKSEYFQNNVIGVVFEKVIPKQKISEKIGLLDGSGILIVTNFDTNWIVNELCDD